MVAYGAATDLLYALFPIAIVWPLQMPRKRKIQLAGIMSFGTLYVDLYLSVMINRNTDYSKLSSCRRHQDLLFAAASLTRRLYLQVSLR